MLLHLLSSAPLKIESRVAVSDEMDIPKVVVVLILAAVFLFLTFFFRKRFLRIFCACATEVCLFLVCIDFFGDNSIITWIMRWVTAAVACILTVAVVNRINWKQKKVSFEKRN